MKNFTIWIITPHGYSHSHCFDHVAATLAQTIGENCQIVTDGHKCTHGTTIVLGGHLLRAIDYLPNTRLIFYNLEQIDDASTWMSEYYLGLLRKHSVWDYSVGNVQKLSMLGIIAKLCEVGYSPYLTRLPQDTGKDIPILFYGSLNPRREKIINELGTLCHHAFNVYGDELDSLIARSKIVLNMHYYKAKEFEIVRCSYLFANKKCIVSEVGGGDAIYRNTGAFTSYDNLVWLCRGLLADEPARQKVAKAGYDIFSARGQQLPI